LEKYKLKKSVSRTISVPIGIAGFFDWLTDNEYNRNELIEDSLHKTDLFKRYIKEKKDEENLGGGN